MSLSKIAYFPIRGQVLKENGIEVLQDKVVEVIQDSAEVCIYSTGASPIALWAGGGQGLGG